jgi:hypothetical protein
MAHGERVLDEAIATTALQDVSQWPQPTGLQDRHHRGEKEDRLNPWRGAAVHLEEYLEVLHQRKYVQSLFQKKQEAEALPEAVWWLWSTVAQQLGALHQQLGAQRQQLEAQQRELDLLKRQLQGAPSAETRAVPDEFQRWMMDHRSEVAAHRGKHIAVHPTQGIVASADSYASLVDELDRRGVPDTEVVLEFISPMFSAK